LKALLELGDADERGINPAQTAAIDFNATRTALVARRMGMRLAPAE